MKRHRLLIVLLLCLSLYAEALYAEGKDKISEEIKTHKSRLKGIERRITQQKKRLWEIKREESGILKRLNALNREIYKSEAKLSRIRHRLSRIEKESKRIEKEILILEERLAKQRQRLSKRLRAMYKFRRLGYLEAILTAPDFADLIRRTHFIGLIALEDAKLIRLTKEKMDKIEAKKREILEKKRELERLRREEEMALAICEAQRRSRKRLLAKIQESKMIYLSRINELEKASKGIRRLIERLESKRKGLVGLSPRILRLKGYLPWPLKGEVIRGFGPYMHPRFNIQVNNKGIDIRAPYGQKVTSVLDGEVVFADYFKGYGRLAMIDHGGGLYSLYAYLSDIFVQKGDFVSTGSLIGRVGEGENPGEGCLHFELRANGEAINPLEWLKRR